MIFDSVVIDIYTEEERWPEEGTPADWIYNQEVGYTDGEKFDYIVYTPLWRILWWKTKHFFSTTHTRFSGWWWSLGRDVDAEWENMVSQASPLSEEEEEEMDDEWRSALHMKKKKK